MSKVLIFIRDAICILFGLVGVVSWIILLWAINM